jgi:hypothetical protein
MQGHLMILIFLLLVAAALIWGFYWEERRSHQILRDWAAREGMKILSADRSHARAATAIASIAAPSSSQVLFHVTVQDSQGLTRRARVICGSRWLGIVRNVAVATWE